MYQDACCSLPSIKVHGEEYQPRSAWKDIAQSIEQATNFIYMTGNRNYADITLFVFNLN